MLLTQKYNGALLFGDTKLFVMNNNNEKSFISIKDFNQANKNREYSSYYKGLKGRFKIVKCPEIPDSKYEVLLSNDKLFTCGINHKAMVYRNRNPIENFKSSELLPIQFIIKNQTNTYIPWKNIEDENSVIDISFISIKSITRSENTTHDPVFGIVFESSSPSILLMLENGIVIKGDKESNITVNVECKNTA
jgi:hypothetical protein